ncbi:MAG TPA: CHAT domain-containing protein, partial [Rhodothermia bacterium]|nr:CHAT domain-containing protein [Rhodothermia bacterium]
MDEGDYEEAFHYNERARAFEPLQLILQIQNIPRKFRRLTRNGEPMRLRDVQAELPPDTFIIEYCVLEDRTYAWVISRDEVEVLTLPAGRAEAERWSNDLQDAAADRNAPVFVRHLTTPYAELLEGPLAAVAAMPNNTMPRLVFVPDGGLHGLPFAALRNSMTGKHLVQDAVVSNAGSATLYVFSLLQDEALSRDEPPTALLIGNPAFDAQFAHLGNLPGAESEVRRIRADYDDRAEVRIGAEATVHAFLDLAPKSTVVHVAAHAIANPVAPYRSMLLLARSADRSGAIDAEELLTRLKLDRTKLVVLSTCKSAGGLPVGPEGVAPLVRPFLTAGVPAV